MSERLDARIRAAVHALVSASPPPPDRFEVLRRVEHRAGVLATVARSIAVAVAVVAVGAAGILLGRFVFPETPDDPVRVVAGQRALDPRFDAGDLGDEVRLLPASGDVDPVVGDGNGAVVGDVVAVGGPEGSDVEAFTWRSVIEGVEGWCVQVFTPTSRETACSASRTPPPVHGPRTFPHPDLGEGPSGTVVTWRVPESSSVASLEVGELRLWQVPVGGVAVFVIDQPAISVAYLEGWSVEGASLGRIGFGADFVDDDATGTVDGALPDGRAYTVTGLGRSGERIEGISAAVVVESGTEDPMVIGIADFFGPPTEASEPLWSGDTLVIPAEASTIRIAVYPHVLEAIGAEGRDVLAAAVRGSTVAGLPVLHLAPPLRFAGDDEVPVQMEVMYETFAMRRGCTPSLGGICSDDSRVQAIPLRNLVSDARPAPDTLAIASADLPVATWTGPTPDVDIEGLWVLVAFEIDGVWTRVEESSNTWRIPYVEIGEFLGGHLGCNHFGGRYALQGATLLPDNAFSTLAGCGGDLMAAELAMRSVLFDADETLVQVLLGSMWWTTEEARLLFVPADEPPPAPEEPPGSTFGRLDCSPGHVVREDVPGPADPEALLRGAAPSVVQVVPERLEGAGVRREDPVFWWGYDEAARVIAAVAWNDVTPVTYTILTCDQTPR